MDEKTRHALRHNAGHFQIFARNGRWGTCVDCPRDSMSNVYPEFCENTERYDHQLTLKGLFENYEHSLKTYR